MFFIGLTGSFPTSYLVSYDFVRLFAPSRSASPDCKLDLRENTHFVGLEGPTPCGHIFFPEPLPAAEDPFVVAVVVCYSEFGGRTPLNTTWCCLNLGETPEQPVVFFVCLSLGVCMYVCVCTGLFGWVWLFGCGHLVA